MGAFAGVILAGGKSSRMGQNKALMMTHQGERFIDVAAARLREAGASKVMVSGDVGGYDCLPDQSPHAGPACAILGMTRALLAYEGAVFIPVDIPLMTADLLRNLTESRDGAFYEGHPLPAYLPVLKMSLVSARDELSVRQMLDEMEISPIRLAQEEEGRFLNINTPEEYGRLA